MGNLRFLGNFIIFYFIGFNLYFWLQKKLVAIIANQAKQINEQPET
jgi:hypothetical protein